MQSFETAVVTGGSRGLGRALALALASRGTAVAVVARHEAPLEAVVNAIVEEGGRAHAIVADVGEPDAAVRIAGQALSALGHVDLLVHNASTLGAVPLPMLTDLRGEDLERTLAVNVLGPHRLTRALLPSMRLGRGGVVVGISSDAAIEAYPGWGGYGASKAALDQLLRGWAEELRGTGVRVLCIDPGEMDTQMHADAVPDADRSRLGRPDVVASIIVDILVHPERAPSGARILATEWEVRA